MATIADTVTVPLATKVDRKPSVPLAMIVALFTNIVFKFYRQKPGTGSQKIGSERVNWSMFNTFGEITDIRQVNE